MIAADGFPVTTPCPAPCGPDCEPGTGWCHERHRPARERGHDPEQCERQRAALDEHSRLSAELGDAS